jgi:hypothetical protein
MNFKSIIIPASLSFIFGVYSLYGAFIYYFDISYKSDICDLKKYVYKTATKCEELDKKYDDLLSEFTKLKDKVFYLTNKDINDDLFDKVDQSETVDESEVDQLEVDDKSEVDQLEVDQLEVDQSEVVDNSEVDLKDINRIVPYFIDDGVEPEFDFLEETGIINHLHLVKNRSVSITEVDWTGVAKKMFFG